MTAFNLKEQYKEKSLACISELKPLKLVDMRGLMFSDVLAAKDPKLEKYYVVLKEYYWDTTKSYGFNHSVYTMHCDEIPGLKIGDIIFPDDVSGETDNEGFTITSFSKSRRKVIAFSEVPIGAEKIIK